MLTELPAEFIAFNTTFQIQYSPIHTGNELESCTKDFAYCMSLIGTFQNLVTENYNPFMFFSMREWAEFKKSCNLIGSGSGWNFLIRLAHGRKNPSLDCVSLCDDLTFPFFFLTPIPFTYRGYFSLDKRFANRIEIKIYFSLKRSVCKSL